MLFRLHPDKRVHIELDDQSLYSGTLEQFQVDANAAMPPLPPGMVSFTYDTDAKILTYYDKKQNAFPVEGEAEHPFARSACTIAPALEQLAIQRELPQATLPSTIPVVK